MSLRSAYLTAVRQGTASQLALEHFAAVAVADRDAALLGSTLGAMTDPAVRRRTALAATRDPALLQGVLGHAGLLTDADLTTLGWSLADDELIRVAQLLGERFTTDLTALAEALWERGNREVRIELLTTMDHFDAPEQWIEWALDPAATGTSVVDLVRDLLEHEHVARTLVLHARSYAALTVLVSFNYHQIEHPAVASLVNELLEACTSTDISPDALDLVSLLGRYAPGSTIRRHVRRIATTTGHQLLARYAYPPQDASALHAHQVGMYLSLDAPGAADRLTLTELLTMHRSDRTWRTEAAVASLGGPPWNPR